MNVPVGVQEYAEPPVYPVAQKPLIAFGNSLVISYTATALAVGFGTVIVYSACTLPSQVDTMAQGPATLGIRPEHVKIVENGSGDLQLPLRLVEPMGKEALLNFESGAEQPFVVVSEGLSMARRRENGFGLALAPEHIFLFGSTAGAYDRKAAARDDCTRSPGRPWRASDRLETR